MLSVSTEVFPVTVMVPVWLALPRLSAKLLAPSVIEAAKICPLPLSKLALASKIVLPRFI